MSNFNLSRVFTFPSTNSCVTIRFFLLAIINIFLINTMHSQNDPCGFDDAYDSLLVDNPQIEAQFEYQEALIQLLMKEDSMAVVSGETYTIPVVVNIIHLGESVGSGTNISDNQVYSAISDLNDRYSNSNELGVDIDIEFCLAQRDPNGYSTDGIIRVNGYGTCANGACYQNVGLTFSPSGNEIEVKSLSRWPAKDYFNIWVVSKIHGSDSTGYQGFAYPPGTPASKDGTVVLYNAFGTTGNLKSITNLNTVITHEIGHGMNLLHTFHGDFSGTACPVNDNCNFDGDRLCDTPPHIRSASFTCDSTGTNSCDGGSANSLFVHNYYELL